MSFTINERMSRYPFISEMEMSAVAAYNLMTECQIRHLPVMAKDKVIGIVSERDLLKVLGDVNASTTMVSDIMTMDPYVVDKDTPLEEVVSVMADEKIGCAIVGNEAQQIVGIFTTTDALYLLAELLKQDAFQYSTSPVERFMSRLELASV